MRTCFLGSPLEVIPILDALREHTDLVAVVTQPAKPTGRGKIIIDPPVAECAKKLNLNVLQPLSSRSPEFIAQLRALKIDVCVTAAYGQILSDEFLAVPKRATVNVHPSLLPQYRGATPIPSALLNGDQKTGITILFTVKKLDAGAIIEQKAYEIHSGETAGELTKRLFSESITLLIPALKKLETDSAFIGTAQLEENSSHCKKIAKADGLIDWAQSADQIYNKYAAYTPWPGVYTFSAENKRYILGKIAVSSAELSDTPGTTHVANQNLIVSCGKGSIAIYTLQPEGKKMISAKDFLNSGQKLTLR